MITGYGMLSFAPRDIWIRDLPCWWLQEPSYSITETCCRRQIIKDHICFISKVRTEQCVAHKRGIQSIFVKQFPPNRARISFKCSQRPPPALLRRSSCSPSCLPSPCLPRWALGQSLTDFRGGQPGLHWNRRGTADKGKCHLWTQRRRTGKKSCGSLTLRDFGEESFQVQRTEMHTPNNVFMQIKVTKT